MLGHGFKFAVVIGASSPTGPPRPTAHDIDRFRLDRPALTGRWENSYARDGRLSGKVAIVTGSASGIGRAIAERYAAEGASVVIADVNGDAAEAVAAPLDAALAVRCDVTSRDDCDRLFAATIERFSKLDILVNNAALTATERPTSRRPTTTGGTPSSAST